MAIQYKETHDFSAKELEELFLSVKWSSGHYPDKLAVAMKNFETVYTAWDGAELVGLICAMDDGIMTAYIHYLLVRPAYQKLGIGKELVEKMKEKYKDYLRIVLVAYNKETGFYEACGFKKANDSSPMFTPRCGLERQKSRGYTLPKESRVLLCLERTGEVLTCCCALCFSNFNRQGLFGLGLAVG